MHAAPDLIEPITGWRLWAVGPSGPGDVLISPLRRRVTWHPGRELVAACTATSHFGGDAPVRGCSCGIHAFAERNRAVRLLAALAPQSSAPMVVGRVRLWGRVAVCEDGYRAQCAYPAEMWVPPPAGWLERGLARYGGPVHAMPAEWWDEARRKGAAA